MKTLFKMLLIGLVSINLTACWEWKEYPLDFQFAQEDLDCLFSNNLDSFVLFTNTPFKEFDMAYYLRNGRDTIGEQVETGIFSQMISMGAPISDNFINGYSKIKFDNCPFLKTAEFSMGMWSSDKHPDWTLYLYASKYVADTLNEYMGISLKALDSTFIDTANIQGTTYDQVYKVYVRDENPNRFKSVYFRRGYGFLQIVMRDTQRIELIGYKNLKLKPLSFPEKRLSSF